MRITRVYKCRNGILPDFVRGFVSGHFVATEKLFKLSISYVIYDEEVHGPGDLC